ncbi:MAG TPA: helicase C-terminal domain-containing protein [Methanosarcina sp.]|nr:helicase C-terminal domain-containing protein [Methanosarcina sp.]
MIEIHKYFPLDTDPREGQVEAINGTIDAFDKGYKTVVVEAPVGSGKSAIAMTIAAYLGDSHLLTPRKALQDQYFNDFSDRVALMKGRGAYPCYPAEGTENSRLNMAIYKNEKMGRKIPLFDALGSIDNGFSPPFEGLSCAQGPCLEDTATKNLCLETTVCCYKAAISTALRNDHVVHNLHSFIFQAYFANYFDTRDLLVVDESHDMEDIIRDFLTRTITVYKHLEVYPDGDDYDEWVRFLSQEEFRPADGSKERERFDEQLEKFLEYRMKNFVVDVKTNDFGIINKTTFRFIPKHIGNAAENLLLGYGKKRLLMSGTIYDKDYFCFRNGIDKNETAFIKIDSTFPIKNRPIIMKEKYLTDNSHKSWGDSFEKIVSNIKDIMSKMPNVRGLIHAPSYELGRRLELALADTGRVMSHTPETFQTSLNWFFENSPDNAVFISPVCQQGVDFKYDRARFQIIVRVPFPNAGDVFVKEMMKDDFDWYNYKTLITFGQMLGRVVRAEDDHGVTILLDSRFKTFIRRNRKFLPADVLASIRER